MITFVVTAYPGATLAAPTDGVITRWRVREPGTQNGAMSPRVPRAAGAGSYTALRTGAQVPVGTSATVKTYPTRLPIGAGEFFGVDSNTGPTTTVTGAAFTIALPAIADGATGAFGAAAAHSA